MVRGFSFANDRFSSLSSGSFSPFASLFSFSRSSPSLPFFSLSSRSFSAPLSGFDFAASFFFGDAGGPSAALSSSFSSSKDFFSASSASSPAESDPISASPFFTVLLGQRVRWFKWGIRSLRKF